MQQTTAASAPDTKKLGALTIVAQITTDGGYSINTFTGPEREANLCFTTPDRDTFRLAYKVIGEGGLNGVRPDGIRAALTEALTDELHRMQRRSDTPSRERVEHLNALLDLVDAVSEEALRALTEPARPRTFADLRDAHAAAVRRDQATRKQVA
jgi:hypothetical protein